MTMVCEVVLRARQPGALRHSTVALWFCEPFVDSGTNNQYKTASQAKHHLEHVGRGMRLPQIHARNNANQHQHDTCQLDASGNLQSCFHAILHSGQHNSITTTVTFGAQPLFRAARHPASLERRAGAHFHHFTAATLTLQHGTGFAGVDAADRLDNSLNQAQGHSRMVRLF